MFIFVYWMQQKNNAICILLYCVSVKLSGIVRSWKRDKFGRVSWFNDFIGRFSRATKPRRQKLANFIDRLTSH